MLTTLLFPLVHSLTGLFGHRYWGLALLLTSAATSLLQAQQFILRPPLRQLTHSPTGSTSLLAWYMTQDAQGAIWLATTNGLVRYDGQHLRVLHAPGQPREDDYGRPVITVNGSLWVPQSHGNRASQLVYVEPAGKQIRRVADTII